MKKNCFWPTCVAALALALVALPVTAQEDETAAPDPYLYAIDKTHTDVGFKVSHLTVSKVRGNFTTFDGTVRYNPENLADSGVEFTIDASSIDTGNEDRDKHLRSADFLDVENHPNLTFKSTKVEKSDDGMVVTGDLTMRGVTREVSFPFEKIGPITDPFGMQRIGVEASLTVDRRDWGLEWSRAMETGGLIVGHEVEIELHTEATRK